MAPVQLINPAWKELNKNVAHDYNKGMTTYTDDAGNEHNFVMPIEQIRQNQMRQEYVTDDGYINPDYIPYSMPMSAQSYNSVGGK
jgi:hypothetical protein